MEAPPRISGVSKVTKVFGDWPSFQDAEVVWMRLDRRSAGRGSGPTVDAMVHAFEVARANSPNGGYVLRKSVLVQLRFHDVTEVTIDGFNYQNALGGLVIEEPEEPQSGRVPFQVEFDPSHGVGASLQCGHVEVVCVKPCNGNGDPIET
jgi:hypothetical protein